MKLRITVALIACALLSGCLPDSSESRLSVRQEQQLEQSTAKVGIPYLPNARELRLAHDIYELRDKPVPTYVYVFANMRGCFVYMGPAIGYPIPYAAQMTAPRVSYATAVKSPTISVNAHGDDQAEPNGLFMPSSAEGTWIMVPDGKGGVEARYFEERINVMQSRLTHGECPESK